MDKAVFKILLILLTVFCIPPYATGTVITSDTVWEGEVFVFEDIVVPQGIALTIKPGTVIKVTPSERTKTDPEYASTLTEITIRGTLRAHGSEESPIVFIMNEEGKSNVWAGLIIDGGTADLKSCRIQNTETG